MNSEGSFLWYDGKKYTGNFFNGKMHGMGALTFKNGKCIVG